MERLEAIHPSKSHHLRIPDQPKLPAQQFKFGYKAHDDASSSTSRFGAKNGWTTHDGEVHRY